jgi:hypothetical protein
MFHLLTSKHNRDNDCNLEGFGVYWDSDDAYVADYSSGGNFKTKLGTGLAEGQAKAVSFKPLFGIFNQPRYIPLQFCPLTVEFELVTSATDAIATELAGSQFPTAETSQSWEISDCQIKADVVELDSAVHNEYASHVMQGHPIPINYTSYITQLQTVSGGNINVNITRSCSRLKAIFISFDKAADAVANNARTLIKKPWNYFYHPMQKGNYDKDKEMQIQVQQDLVDSKVTKVGQVLRDQRHLKD